MELTLDLEDGIPVAHTLGPLDETARGVFREHLHPLVGKPGGRLVLDLAGSPRINSAGIGNLVALTADANTNESLVVLCNLQPYVEMVVRVTKLDRYFAVEPDVPAAVARCKATASSAS
jgi:anti-anti-sigma factor